MDEAVVRTAVSKKGNTSRVRVCVGKLKCGEVCGSEAGEESRKTTVL